MIALDTNALLRFLLRDDEARFTTVNRVVRHARRDAVPLYVADVVLCEVGWVLASRGKMARVAIAELLGELLESELVEFEDEPAVERALRRYSAGRGDFPDYLLRERALAAGATEVVTFDRDLRGEAGFRVLGG